MTNFSDFALSAPIQAALATAGYTQPTPIQSQAIPPVLAGRDVCGIAQTGTGKTAAFALPILQRLSETRQPGGARHPRVLVLSPTRELATQIADSFKRYGAGLKLVTATVFGGVSQRPQVDAIRRGVDIIVATPGRLLDLIDQRLLSLSTIEILVVDEADQMLDLGFIVPLRKIVRLVPAKRQTLFFSATMPAAIADLAGTILSEPVQVAVAPVATTVERVEQSITFVTQAGKQQLLNHLLKDPALDRVLVFTRTKHGADKVVVQLDRAGINAAAIHGNKSQAQRERALASFKAGGTRVLVATDIAARGIHVESVSHVVNFDLPNVPESYVHRIGRTARAGAAGQAIAFCAADERPLLRDIEKLTRMAVPVAPLPESLAALAAGGSQPSGSSKGPGQRGARAGNGRGGRPARQADGQRSSNQAPANNGQRHREDDRQRGQRQAHGGPGHANGAQQRNGGRQHNGNQGGGRSNENRRPEPRGIDTSTGLPQFLSRPAPREHAGA